jgi:hypothetical protein
MTIDEIRLLGISRVGDNDKSLLVSLSRRPTDDEMRNVHAALDAGHQRFGEVLRERDTLRTALLRACDAAEDMRDPKTDAELDVAYSEIAALREIGSK